MAKMNFQSMEVFSDIARKTGSRQDIRESFANLLYTSGTGIAAHALALRIYGSEGEIEVSGPEAKLIRETAQQLCTQRYIDAITAQLKTEK
jgi:hypothetical protein